MKCECGRDLSPHSLKCRWCGRTLYLDADVIGVQIPEPPVDQWREELLNRPKASKESMAEVMRESDARRKSQNKRKKVKKTEKRYKGSLIGRPSRVRKLTAFLVFALIISGLIYLASHFATFLLVHSGYLTYALTALTCVISLMGFRNSRIIERFKFQSALVYEQGEYSRTLTTGFVHADLGHLFFNMTSLFSIGVGTEYEFNRLFGLNGPALFISLYIFSLTSCNLPRMIRHRHDRFGSSVGASGAILGLLSALVIINPSILIWGAIPGRYFLLAFLIVSYFLARKSTSRIDHAAHIYGAVFGFIFILAVGRYYGIDFLASLSR